MSWESEIDEIRRRVELAKQMGGEANVERQHAGGKLTVRERIERLLDPASFHEMGALAGKPTYSNGQLVSFIPSNYVMGTGRINGRRVVIGGDDFTVRGGAADARVGDKAGYAEKMAHELRLPIIRLVDGTGGGGSVRTLETSQRTYVPANPAWDVVVALLSEVPVVGACLGFSCGPWRSTCRDITFFGHGPRYQPALCCGPPVVERGVGEKVTKEELGGSHIHARGSGSVDNEVETEDEAFAQIRHFLSYLPQNVWQIPSRAAPEDDPRRVARKHCSRLFRAIGAAPITFGNY